MNKDIEYLNKIKQKSSTDLPDITEHCTKQQNTHFSEVHVGYFFQIDQILNHKASLNKYKRTEKVCSLTTVE